MMKKLLLLCFVCCLPLALFADGYKYFVYDNIQYAYLSDWEKDEYGNKYRSVRVAHFKKNGVYYKGDLVIPASFKKGGTEYRVEGILSDAFGGSDDLTSVTVLSPNIYLQGSVFAYRRNLERVVFENAPTSLGDWNNSLCCYAFFKNCTHYIKRTSMKSIKAQVVREEIDTRHDADYKDKYYYSVIDTLHIKSKGQIAFVHSNHVNAGRVNTLVIDEITEHRPSPYIRDTTVVYYLNVDNVVLGSGVTKLYDNMFTGDLKSITVQGTIKQASPHAFHNISNLERYDAGNNQNVVAAIEYKMGSELDSLGEAEKAIPHLRKASELGLGLATELLARHEKDAKGWKEKMTLSVAQGNKDVNPQLQAMEFCQNLRELYPSVADQAESLTCDTTQLRNVQAMCQANGIDIALMNRQENNTALKYDFPGYEDIRNKGLDMCAYYLVCKELTRKRLAQYYEAPPRQSLIWFGKERDADIKALDDALRYSKIYSEQSALKFRPFFAKAIEKLTTMREEIWERSEKEHQLVIENHEKNARAEASLRASNSRGWFNSSGGGGSSRSSSSSSSSVNPDADVSYTILESYREVGSFSRPSTHYSLELKVEFKDGTTAYIYKVPDKPYYMPSPGEGSYSTEADAAAAAYFWKKHKLVRNKGKGREYSAF